MEKQTVMQELLEFCEYRQTKAADGCKAAWNMILAKIKDDSLIEKEKEQMSQADSNGYNRNQYNHDLEYGGSEYWEEIPQEFEQYYKETYEK